ncbi:hypothetical protein AXG93_131s1200 [Marchantia polymorpha subsp. ruderalis]|uniref:CN hydrolase domain-containing protein n=1 Tax=Marchantia polymorpha subsp. ruderalis TaxID=1480154 RepID=A0A176W016_MARPO|nr:hypothetical protein AXG93_131s1200 [Marchantia polymorpha subsp. ruderalis]
MLEDRAREMANCWPGTLFSRTSAIAILAAAVFMMETGRRLTVANSANQSARVQQRDQMLLQALVLRRTGGDLLDTGLSPVPIKPSAMREGSGLSFVCSLTADFREVRVVTRPGVARASSGALVDARYRSGDESSVRPEAHKAERFMAEAASLGVEVVVFPKAVMVGYPRDAKFGIGSRSAKGREYYRKHHAPAVDEPVSGRRPFGELLARNSVFPYICCGEASGRRPFGFSAPCGRPFSPLQVLSRYPELTHLSNLQDLDRLRGVGWMLEYRAWEFRV